MAGTSWIGSSGSPAKKHTRRKNTKRKVGAGREGSTNEKMEHGKIWRKLKRGGENKATKQLEKKKEEKEGGGQML